MRIILQILAVSHLILRIWVLYFIDLTAGIFHCDLVHNQCSFRINELTRIIRLKDVLLSQNFYLAVFYGMLSCGLAASILPMSKSFFFFPTIFRL